jgi:hypothetical protein
MEKGGFNSEKLRSYFTKKYSEEDESYVNEVFNNINNEKELEHFLSKQFYELISQNDGNKMNLDHILHRIHYEINTKSPKFKGSKFTEMVKWTYRIAGIIMLPIVIFIGIQKYKETNMEKVTWVEINSPAWTRAHFSLPDGTTGWLNSNSSVRYNGNFSADRQVYLNGEAFFNVFKDKSRPFVVKANDVSLKVTGTRFNIASYEDENNVEVVLEEGGLIFKDEGTSRSIAMKPNDLVIYNKTLKNYSTEVVEPQKYLSWTEGKLVFRNDPVDVIARKLERWYNVDVELEGNFTSGLRLRATFVDENLDEVLALLKRSLPINYIVKSRNVGLDETFARKMVIITPDI